MKACPYCEAELRDSVIRCTRCLRSLDAHAGPDEETAPAAAELSPGAAISATPSPAHAAALPPPSQAWAVVPSRRPAPSPDLDLSGRRALPSSRPIAGRPDLVLLFASLTAGAAAYLGWRAVSQPWVELVIHDTTERLDPVLVGEIMLRGDLALIGTFAHALAGGLGTLGVMWLFYGFDRGTTMPWFVSPAFAIAVAVGGIGSAILSSSLWLVWKDAAIARSRSVGLPAEKLRELLDLQPPPLVEIHRLSGLMRFGGVMLVGLLTASTAWWAYRRRG